VGTDQVQTSGTYTYRIEEHGVEYAKHATKLEMAIVIPKVLTVLTPLTCRSLERSYGLLCSNSSKSRGSHLPGSQSARKTVD
jgi:hypothetical protein